jgi:hypothetical protein
MSKTEIVERLLAVERAYADMEDRWLRTADDLLVWVPSSTGCWPYDT